MIDLFWCVTSVIFYKLKLTETKRRQMLYICMDVFLPWILKDLVKCNCGHDRVQSIWADKLKWLNWNIAMCIVHCSCCRNFDNSHFEAVIIIKTIITPKCLKEQRSHAWYQKFLLSMGACVHVMDFVFFNPCYDTENWTIMVLFFHPWHHQRLS